MIQSDGKNKLNIQERKKRGLAAVNQICQLLDELCLGDYYFEAANILRNSLLLSTLLSNSETWYSLTQKEISELDMVDEILLRKIFSAHSKTLKEAESGERKCPNQIHPHGTAGELSSLHHERGRVFTAEKFL